MKGVVVLAAAVTVALLLGTAASPAARSGLHGRVCRGPMPVAAGATSACSVPLRLVFYLVRSGQRYAVRSAVDGRYLVALPPGVYRAQLPIHVGVMPPILRPMTIRVRAGHDDRLDFYLQTKAAVDAGG